MTAIAQLLAQVPSQQRREAEQLISGMLNRSHAWLLANPEFHPDSGLNIRLQQALARLAQGEPLAYQLGYTDFFGLQLTVTRDVLIPRTDTEVLVETTLKLDLPTDARVIDLGCGNGAIACALARHRPGWRIDAVDNRLAALLIASLNIHRLKLWGQINTRLGSWWQAVNSTSYDLVVTNPPYIAPQDLALDPQVAKYEPATALYAQEHGLAAYHKIFAGMATHAPQAVLVCEHGYAQQEQLLALARQYTLTSLQKIQDYQGHNRVLVLAPEI